MKTKLLACALLSIISTGIAYSANMKNNFSFASQKVNDIPRTQVIRIENALGLHDPNQTQGQQLKGVSVTYYDEMHQAPDYCYKSGEHGEWLYYGFQEPSLVMPYLFIGFSGGVKDNLCNNITGILVESKESTYAPLTCNINPKVKLTHVIIAEDTAPNSSTGQGTMKCIVSDENGPVKQHTKTGQ